MTLNSLMESSNVEPYTKRLATDIRYGSYGADLVVLIHREGDIPPHSFVSGVYFVRDLLPGQVAEKFEQFVRTKLVNATMTGGHRGSHYEYTLRGLAGLPLGGYLISHADYFQRPKTLQEAAEEWADMMLSHSKKNAEQHGFTVGQTLASRRATKEFRQTLIGIFKSKHF